MLNGDTETIKNSKYIEKYPYQIGMIWIMGILYKIFNCTNYRLLQCLNIVANIITFIFMYLIFKKMSKKYEVNEIVYWVMCLTFVPLVLLTTYVYGDYIGMALSTIGIYYIMNYKEKGKSINLVISSMAMA